MSRKRQRRDLEDPPLKNSNSINTKRPRYDLRYGQVRECCSLPQYDKQPCQHKYHLRSFEHRKPVNYFGPKQSINNLSEIATRSGICARSRGSAVLPNDIGRNAHSYSINGHIARCSNSSTTSGRQRNLQVSIKKGTAASGKKSGSHQLKKEVSNRFHDSDLIKAHPACCRAGHG